MPRLRQVKRAELTSSRVRETYQQRFGDDEPADRTAVTHGSKGSWWTVLALDEQLFELTLDRHEWQFSSERQLPAQLREFALARTGWVSESAFVYFQHSNLLKRLGVSPVKIAALPSWSTQSCWTSAERAVLAYVDDLVGARGRVDDATFAALQEHLNDVAVLELTQMVCTYVASATMSRALRLELDDHDDGVALACASNSN
jgi:alkylhydroperoxidase family enzyme